MQSQLVQHLKRCPQGLVVLENASSLALQAWPAIQHFLDGQYISDGAPFNTTGAALVLVMPHVPDEELRAMAAEGASSRTAVHSVKDRLIAMFMERLYNQAGSVSFKDRRIGLEPIKSCIKEQFAFPNRLDV